MAANIIYGSGVADDAELRLCGDVSDGARAVELGISPWFNSIALAAAGARAIAVDPEPDRIAELRRRADEADVRVQCIETGLADLGEIASASCRVVVAVERLDDIDDLGRLLRQVHRILEPGMPFVVAMPHPFALVDADHPYGSRSRSIGAWFTSLGRANFRVDQLLELGVGPTTPAPTTLVLRARKEGS